MSGRRSKDKGDRYERAFVKYLNELGLPARRAKRGNDTGDVLGIPKVVFECKDAVEWRLSEWVEQMLVEKLAAQAQFGTVIIKRPRRRDVGEHYFVMTVRDGLLLLQQAGGIELAE